jgi:hypothetical protein
MASLIIFFTALSLLGVRSAREGLHYPPRVSRAPVRLICFLFNCRPFFAPSVSYAFAARHSLRVTALALFVVQG